MTRLRRHVWKIVYGKRPIKRWGKARPVLFDTILFARTTATMKAKPGLKNLPEPSKLGTAVAECPGRSGRNAHRIKSLSKH